VAAKVRHHCCLPHLSTEIGTEPEAYTEFVTSAPCVCIPVLTAGAASQGSQWHRQGVPKWSWGMGEASAEEQPKVCTGCGCHLLRLLLSAEERYAAQPKA
jgi:hypothetical protein